ncbi:hypothetical protein L208DRAFT_1185803, partial [Tricholoma matsutake]
KDICIQSPTDFSGEWTKTTKFLEEIDLYLQINDQVYDTNNKKIIFTLSFMNGGTAAAWVQAFVNQHQSEGLGEYADFQQKVLALEAFSPTDNAGTAKTEIKNLKQGSGNLEEYVANFCIL